MHKSTFIDNFFVLRVIYLASAVPSPTAPTLESILAEVPSPTAPTLESILSDVPTSRVDCTSRHQDRPINGSDPPPSYDRVIQDDIQREQELTNRVDALESERQLNNMGRENRALSMLTQHIRGAARNEQASIGNQRIDGRSRQRRRFSNEDFNDIGPPGQSDQRDSGFNYATNSRVHHPSVSSSGSCDDQAMYDTCIPVSLLLYKLMKYTMNYFTSVTMSYIITVIRHASFNFPFPFL